MKKIVYSTFILLSAFAFLTSCSKDDDGGNSSEIMSATPAADIEGTYNGQWKTTVSWVTDDPQRVKAGTSKVTLFDGDVAGQAVLKATQAYIASMATIGQDVVGVDPDGNPATISVLTGTADTPSLQSKVNVMEQSGAVYTLTNQVANDADSLGLITAAGIQGNVKDGQLTVSFSRQDTKKGDATKMEVLNAAYGLCSTDKEKRNVVIIPTELTKYTYSFTGKK